MAFPPEIAELKCRGEMPPDQYCNRCRKTAEGASGNVWYHWPVPRNWDLCEPCGTELGVTNIVDIRRWQCGVPAFCRDPSEVDRLLSVVSSPSRLDLASTAVALRSERGELPVYAMFGHGGDLVDNPPLRIPEGCVYVTSEICGNFSFNLPVLSIAFMDPSIQFALKNPVKYKKELRDYFKFDIHVHHHGAEGSDGEYIDTMNSRLAQQVIKDKVNIYKSGIVKLEDYTPYDKVDVLSKQLYKTYGLDTAVTQEDYAEIFSGAGGIHAQRIRAVAIDQGDTFRRMIEKSTGGSPKLSDLFKTLPGIYFNFACRSYVRSNAVRVPNNTVKARVTRQRRRSLGLGEFNRHKLLEEPIYLPGNNIKQVLLAREISGSLEGDDTWILKFIYSEYEEFLLTDIGSSMYRWLINHLLSRLALGEYAELNEDRDELNILKGLARGTIIDKIKFISIWLKYLQIETTVRMRGMTAEDFEEDIGDQLRSKLRIYSRLENKSIPALKYEDIRDDELKSEVCLVVDELKPITEAALNKADMYMLTLNPINPFFEIRTKSPELYIDLVKEIKKKNKQEILTIIRDTVDRTISEDDYPNMPYANLVRRLLKRFVGEELIPMLEGGRRNKRKTRKVSRSMKKRR